MGTINCAFKFIGNTGQQESQKVNIELRRNFETNEFYGVITTYDRLTGARLDAVPFSVDSDPDAIKRFLSGLLIDE